MGVLSGRVAMGGLLEVIDPFCSVFNAFGDAVVCLVALVPSLPVSADCFNTCTSSETTLRRYRKMWKTN